MDIKKTRSIYCTESELRRLKIALDMIRFYDNCGLMPFKEGDAEKSVLKILKGLEPHD